jgi:hypothetical protein
MTAGVVFDRFTVPMTVSPDRWRLAAMIWLSQE